VFLLLLLTGCTFGWDCKKENSTLICSGNGICCRNKCSCYPGYSGILCEEKENCYGIDCNKGSCNSTTGLCECPQSYKGERCEEMDCGQNGLFDKALNGCVCIEGFGGSYCEQCSKKPMYDPLNKTYVCCPTNIKENPFVLVAATDDLLYRYLGGLMANSECVFPNTTLNNGKMKLDCSCNILYNTNNKGKYQIGVHSPINVMTSAALLGVMLANQDSVLNKKWKEEFAAASSGCGDLSSISGIVALIVVVGVIGVLIVAAITWVTWSYNKSLMRETTTKQEIEYKEEMESRILAKEKRFKKKIQNQDNSSSIDSLFQPAKNQQ